MSIHFFDRIGMDYVSCSPYRIPVAKVAAAKAHIWSTSGERLMLQCRLVEFCLLVVDDMTWHDMTSYTHTSLPSYLQE
jgi:hypothetical protein